MKFALRILGLLLLLAVELYAVYAVLHPNVSREYRAYYIDHTTRDWNVPRYSATPADGIQFGKPGWPTFVRFTTGISSREDWGRWTDASLQPSATIVMDRQLSGPLCIEFTGRPSMSQRGKKIDVVLGKNVGSVTLDNPDNATYHVSFADAQPADTLELRFEEPVPENRDFTHNGTDDRRLGLGITSLKILPSVCKTGS